MKVAKDYTETSANCESFASVNEHQSCQTYLATQDFKCSNVQILFSAIMDNKGAKSGCKVLSS